MKRIRKVKGGRFIHTGESQQMFSPVWVIMLHSACVSLMVLKNMWEKREKGDEEESKQKKK